MAKNPTFVTVVALALSDESDRRLMHRRPPDKHHGGLWEFPGGKVEPGETPRKALVREISEELELSIDPAMLVPAAFAESRAEGDRPAIVILLYTARYGGGAIRALEGGETRWFGRAEIARLPRPPLDVALSERLLEPPG